MIASNHSVWVIFDILVLFLELLMDPKSVESNSAYVPPSPLMVDRNNCTFNRVDVLAHMAKVSIVAVGNLHDSLDSGTTKKTANR